jgi:hypothetical protein
MDIIEETDFGTKKTTREALEKTRRDFKDGDEFAQELNDVWLKILRDAISGCPWQTGALAGTIRIVKIPLGMLTGS